MTLKALSESQTDLSVGQLWRIVVEASELPTLVILLPDGSSDSSILFELDTSLPGYGPLISYAYVAEVAVQDPGRHVGAVSAAGESGLLFQAWVAAVTLNADLPDADDLNDWLGGDGTHSFTEPEMTAELAVAARAQRNHCLIPASYPEDLREALLRRAARLLYLRRQLTAEPRTDADYDTPPTFPPGRDFTTRELETPYLRLPTG